MVALVDQSPTESDRPPYLRDAQKPTLQELVDLGPKTVAKGPWSEVKSTGGMV